MTKQERAAVTRRALLDAAAREFAANGYAGTSLSRVVTATGMTMGALTFHYPSKRALAEAVQDDGMQATRALLPPRRSTWQLKDVIDFTRALTRSLESTPSIRAAARLSREERMGAVQWHECWSSTLFEALESLWSAERIHSPLRPNTVATMLAYTLIGVEASTTLQRFPGPVDPAGHADGLGPAWSVLGAALERDAPPAANRRTAEPDR